MTANKVLIPGIAALAVVVGLAGGSLLSSAAATAATADTSSTTASSTDSASSSASSQPDPSQGGHSYNGVTEQPLSGDTLTKATDAAKAAVPGATVLRAETDAEGAAYEVHMTKSNGSKVTVKLDSSFNVSSTEDGMR
jgi:uncharacterized membrane protein YkoI